MFPLHLAVLYGFSDCCRKLLSSGLHLSHTSVHTDSILHPSTSILSLVLHPPLPPPSTSPTGQLYSIVSSMSKEHVLSAGFDINTPDNFGRTCLHAAASGG